jgi:hypothetical protein
MDSFAVGKDNAVALLPVCLVGKRDNEPVSPRQHFEIVGSEHGGNAGQR